MIEAFIGILILLLVIKLVFWLAVLIFSPFILILGLLISIPLFIFAMIGGVLLLMLKVLLLPLLLLLLLPFCWVS
ncbi:hypothetical protein OS175_00270 [Marinicella sp. S1101]|uniref:hypothetical protein n=1 Tax=Marinicella marina TaxID=2996016 RepID=UPI002260DE41|nr:hypothetical protein [Marinicella marina]MCX7552296.1 hypothetical protein [Marinicella marina]MDJ1139172.1 hypothetical protein [Marinicella marina]